MTYRITILYVYKINKIYKKSLVKKLKNVIFVKFYETYNISTFM